MEQDRQGIELRMMREHVDFGGKDVLEVGCGSGRVSAMLAPLVKSLVAIDPDESRLSTARSNVPGVDFRPGRGEELEFPESSFDIVAFTFSLHHQDSGKALIEAHRVLRPQGRIIIVEPAIDGDMHFLFQIFKDEDGKITEALSAINESGLVCESQKTFDIPYRFEDAEELHTYFFSHYGMAGDSTYRERMNRVLGDKSSQRPIDLVETVNLFVLKNI